MTGTKQLRRAIQRIVVLPLIMVMATIGGMRMRADQFMHGFGKRGHFRQQKG